MVQPVELYGQQIDKITIEREFLSRKEKYLPLLRLATFLYLLFSVYNYLINNDINHLFPIFLVLAAFLFFTWKDNILKGGIKRADLLIQICRNEIKSVNGDFSPFEPGNGYIDPVHRYAYDLDLFGKVSLFQCIDRCATIFGRNRLADYFKNAFDFKGLIDERQKAITELSDIKDFRQQVQLVFYGQKSEEMDRLELNKWLQGEQTFLDNRFFNIIRTVLPVATCSSTVLSICGYVVYYFPVTMVILQLLIVTFYARRTIKAQSVLSSQMAVLSKYAQFLLLIEKKDFKSPFLVELKLKLSHDHIEPPSAIIKKLSTLLNWMDSNLNILAAVLLNGLFLFNLQLLAAIEKWRSRYKNDVPQWFDVMAEIDALSSLANFAYNNPGYIYPKPMEGGQFLFDAVDLGHPLVPKDECVTNSISISGWKQYCIITGANMSGKSTFLRTVGTNYVLAMIGAPVFAKKFDFSPVILHSSIRTSDSLAKKESFFYAELKRLKEIIAELEGGQRVFILLDEILKGTNSRDKQSGSIAIIEQFIKYRSVGLIATHDLILGELAKHYPANISNYCFEIQIADNEMSIDYKLREGVCKNLNATYLMKKMGIIID